jgi:stage IV sporulation protein FB
MLIGEPPPSPADLHFRLFGIPVRVHPWFWIVALMLGLSGEGPADPLKTLVWVVVMFASVVIHELGHAFLQRRFGGRPWITLYGLGGLASCDDCDVSPRRQILISLAGPMAGFVFAAVVGLLVRASGRAIGFAPITGEFDWESLGIQSAVIQPMILFNVYFEPMSSSLANSVVADLLQINILWGLVNLLPIYPLDGGRVARELFTLGHSRRGIVQSLWLSIITAGAIAVFGLTRNSIFTALMFGYLAYVNYQTLQSYQSHWR